MNPILRILATTDGSVTKIIEALTGESVEIRTLAQRVVKADERISRLLNVANGELVNWRVVEIVSGGVTYALAVSFLPLARANDGVREDLMKADMPIGKILRKHELEVRREIRWAKLKRIPGLRNRFGEDTFLVRNYDIVHRGSVLFNITEYFPVERITRKFYESKELS